MNGRIDDPSAKRFNELVPLRASLLNSPAREWGPGARLTGGLCFCGRQSQSVTMPQSPRPEACHGFVWNPRSGEKSGRTIIRMASTNGTQVATVDMHDLALMVRAL